MADEEQEPGAAYLQRLFAPDRPPMRPFSVLEHNLFLDALERYGEGNRGDEWDLISKAVASRKPEEVREHACWYHFRLNKMAQGQGLLDCIEDGWTFEEDMIFEHALSQFEENDVDRWIKVSKFLPDKTVDEVRLRYQKLFFDVTRIEAGQQVSVQYRTPAAVMDRTLPSASHTRPKQSRHHSRHEVKRTQQASNHAPAPATAPAAPTDQVPPAAAEPNPQSAGESKMDVDDQRKPTEAQPVNVAEFLQSGHS